MAWTSTSAPTTVWVPVSPGSVISETLLSQIQAEVAAAQAAAAAAAAAEANAETAETNAETAETNAEAAAAQAQTHATNAETFANQAALGAASLTPIPTGGTTDQVLAKASGANYDYYWKTDATGGGGGGGGDISGTVSAGFVPVATGADTIGDSVLAISAGVGSGLTALSLGTTPAQSGAIRLANGEIIKARNSADAADRDLVQLTTGNNAQFGSYSQVSILVGSAIALATDSAVQVWLDDGVLRGETHNDIDLGTTGTRFKDGWFQGTVTATNLAGGGAGLTALNASNIASGTVPPANLGSGSSITTKFLRGDSTWQTISGGGDALTTNPLSQFAATTSLQLKNTISDETGSGALVFATSPTLVTPVLGVATATSVNKVAITTPATSATLTIADGATLTASATATVSGTNTGDQTTITGNAGTATALQTARTINGTSFDGTANITVTAAANTLTGTTLPALNGAALTALNASNLASGTVPDARFPATLPAASGVNLTSLNASNLASGTVGTARLGTGTANTTTFLRGDGSWQVPSATDATKLPLAGGTMTGAINFNGQDADAPRLDQYRERSTDNGNVTGAQFLTWGNGNIQRFRLTGNVNFTPSGFPTSVGASMTIVLKQDATGGRTVTWPASIVWPGGTAPTLSGANKTDVVCLVGTGTGVYFATASLNYTE